LGKAGGFGVLKAGYFDVLELGDFVVKNPGSARF
jgi:hypothetical protein